MTLRAVFVSWDFLFSIIASIAFGFWLPVWVPNELAKDYYGIGISVLSIVFSLFFAALAVVITASDDEFVLFLEEHGDYSALVANYKFTLGLLFVALMYSLVFYAYTAARIATSVRHQNKLFAALFCFLFLWSLFAAFMSTYDSIKYSDYRKRFLQARKKPT